MTKLLGAILLMGGGVWMRCMQVSARRYQRQTLAGMVSALHQMAEEIRMARTPLPALMSMLGRSCVGTEGAFFKEVGAALRGGIPASQAWETALPVLELPRRQTAILAELGAGLHGDEEKICKVILLVTRRLERNLEEWDRTAPDVERRTTGLWLSGAALTVILLI